MTRDDVLALTDSQLVAAVAKKVMWFTVNPSNSPMSAPWMSGGVAAFFNPLEEPRDIAKVITIMRGRGFRFQRMDHQELVSVAVWSIERGPQAVANVSGPFIDEAKLVLQASLIAVEGCG